MSCGLNFTLSGVTGDCSNVSGGSFTILINGTAPDYRIEWVNPSLGTVVLGAGVTAYTATSLTAGTYTFLIKDSCIDPENQSVLASIYVSSGLCSTITGVTNTVCNLNNGSLSAYTQYDYGSNKYYLYHTTLGYITSGTTNLVSGRSFEGLTAGTYYMKVVDNGGCTATTNSVIIKDSTDLTYDLYVVNDAGCNVNSGKIFINNINGSPPYTYLWSNGEITSSISGLTAGSYSVTVSDNSGCVVVKTAEVLKVPLIGQAGVFVSQPACFGSNGSIGIVLSGGTPPFFYSGSNGTTSVTFDRDISFIGLGAGQFTYFVQDAGLCSFNGSVSLITPSSFNIVSITTTNSQCGNNQGSINVNVSNGSQPYVYSIVNSTGVESSISTTLPTYTFTQLASDTYTFSITDNSGCKYTNQYTILNEEVFTFDFDVTGTTCSKNNGNVKVTVVGGSGPYIYELNGESQQTTLTTATFDSLPSGSYIVSVTDTGENCIQSSTLFVTTSDGVDFIYNSGNPNLSNNGFIQLFITTGKAPYTIEWSSNVNGQTGLLVTGLSAGTYTVKVTDSNNCIKIKTIVLVGVSCSVTYSLYNLCDDEFMNNGELLEKTPLLMLNEGYADLVANEDDCILNDATFQAITIVSGVSATSIFYTSTSLTDAPSETLFATTVRNLLLGYEGIGNVAINTNTNKITITSDCGSEVNLLDSNISVNLKINYDISCACSKSCNPYSYLGRIDFMDDEYNVPTQQEITSWGSSNCNCDYTSFENMMTSYDTAITDGLVSQRLDNFTMEFYQYSRNKYYGFCEGDVGFVVPDISLISNVSFPNNFFRKGRPVKIRGNRAIKASQTEGWYTSNIGSTLSAYTDDVRYIRAVTNVGDLPTTGLPGDLINVGTISSPTGYAWNPLTNTWSNSFYDTIDDEVLTEIRTKQDAFAQAKNELILSMKPFTWANNYMILHSIKRFPLNNTPPITGNDIIETNGADLPCGYSQNLNDCTLDPFCGPNKSVDSDEC
jgi:hypothetical protein